MVPLPELARSYKERGIDWIAIGDENYGEGSSREHAAMEPRFLGGRVVLARSFPRIHEANLKKQGILPLTFVDRADYERVRVDDEVDVEGLSELGPGSTVRVVLRHSDGDVDHVIARHTMSEQQIGWFRAGSALNVLAAPR